MLSDRARNLIFAKLGPANPLNLKEVEFAVEMFVVLQNGVRKGLSIARFTQRKGAASSMKRVVQELELRLAKRGYLVQDKTLWKDMESVLTDGAGRSLG